VKGIESEHFLDSKPGDYLAVRKYHAEEHAEQHDNEIHHGGVLSTVEG
jgi:hypothetical protein